jgi:DNA polymerase-1
VILYLDTETPPIARGRLAQRPVCVQWALNGDHPQLDLWNAWTPALEGIELVGANIAYDMACLCVGTPELIPVVFRAYDEGRVRDILLDGKLLDIAAGEYEHRQTKGWSLQELARRAGLRVDKDDDDETGNGSWRLQFASLATVPTAHWPAGAREYALGDVEATRTVHLWQQSRRAEWVKSYGLDPLAPGHSAHAAASAFALHLMSCQGVLTDPVAVERIAVRVEAYIALSKGRLVRAGLVRPDGTKNTKEAARYFTRVCAKRGMAIPRTDGAAKKEAEAREKLARLSDPATERAQRELTKLMNDWEGSVHLPGVKTDKDHAILARSLVMELYADYAAAGLLRGRVERLRQGYVESLQARFDALKETSRTSSSQPKEPLVGDQMQNHPRASGATPAERKRERGFKDRHGVVHKPEYFIGLRECFQPRDGNTFLIADFSMAELHSLSQLNHRLFGHSAMGGLLKAGVDLHIHFGMRSLGRTYESYDKTVDKLHRDRAKPANFGFPGGMGPDKFILYARKSYNVRFEKDEVVELKKAWLQTFPEVYEYLQWIGRLKGATETFTFVHPVTGFVRGGCWYSSGANNGFQHLTAMGAKAALYQVTKACFNPESPLWGYRPWNFVHDEIVVEGPLEGAAEAAEEMATIMDAAFNAYHPDFPTHAEPVLAIRWSKRAEAVRVDGRLVPWTPPEAP